MYRDIIIYKTDKEKKERDISTIYAEVLIGRACIIGNAKISKEDNAVIIETKKVRHELIYLGYDYEMEEQLEINERKNGFMW